jgi:tetratricopeptide (TPR) repeat protein
LADIFLSYARADLAKAERLAEELTDAGFSVWWDRQIHGGARFSSEIDAALTAARSVIVLWSSDSVDSAWVQDEAAVGRDRGCLVPVLLEAVTPPLGFRQYQTVDLSDWNGRGRPPGLDSLIEGVRKTGVHADGGATSARAPRARILRPPRLYIALAAALMTALAIGGWFLWSRPNGRGAEIAMTVAAASSTASDLARQLTIDLSRYQTGPLTALSIGNDDSSAVHSPDFRVEVSSAAAAGNGGSSDLSLFIKGRRGIMWSAAVRTDDGRNDLREQAAARLSAILPCAVKIHRFRGKLSDEAARLFLKGCSPGDVDRADSGPEANLGVYRRLVQVAPDFGPGVANMALLEAMSLPGEDGLDRTRQVVEVRRTIDRAKRLDPTGEEIFAAEAKIQPFTADGWRKSLDLLDAGLEATPESPLLLTVKGMTLRELGLNSDAIEVMRRALAAEPLSPPTVSAFVDVLAYAGRQDEAMRELARAEKIWPTSTNLFSSRARLEMRYGDPRRALAMMSDAVARDTLAPEWRPFIEARLDPTPSKIEAALAPFRARFQRDPRDVVGYLQNLVTFGKVDEAFAVLANPEVYRGLKFATETLFRSHVAPLRADPRFLEVARRLDLLQFWRATDRWPDFCADPALRYDCRTGKPRPPGRAS